MAFVIVSFVLYWLIIPAGVRSLFLAAVSFFYLFAFYPREALFLLILAVAVYVAGVIIKQGRPSQRHLTLGTVIFLVTVLGYFKYASFLADTLNLILEPLAGANLSISQALVPLGISYFTFKMIHYLVDMRQGKVESHGLGDFLNYIFFFPILVSGPIERFQPFLAQSRSLRGLDINNLYAGLPRIASGLFKKMVLADSLAATAALLQQPDLAAGQYWLASLAYTFQLYFDFSGYSDMAIGISRLFGYRIMENFNWPYLARNVSDFWKRWHMSLTGWFRDYLFIPLGGSRGPLGFVIRNTLIVMAVTGLWHGAAWHFVFWGLYHAMGLIVLRLYRKFLLPRLQGHSGLLDSRPSAALSVMLTFMYVNIGWIFFACDASQSIYVLTHMFTGP